MARSALKTTCADNSVRTYEETPVSSFRKRVTEARRQEQIHAVASSADEDIRDSEFHMLMTSNRGVL